MGTVVRPTALAPIRALHVLGCLAPGSSCSMMENQDMSRPCLYGEDSFFGRSDPVERLVFEVRHQGMVA
jgi:hypothetical protein